MAEYILQILKAQLMVVFSWGFHRPTRLPDDKGLKFLVNGFKHKGWVSVEYNAGTDLFDVTIGNERITDVYIENLVDVIDSAVERTYDYEERVKRHYNLA